MTCPDLQNGKVYKVKITTLQEGNNPPVNIRNVPVYVQRGRKNEIVVISVGDDIQEFDPRHDWDDGWNALCGEDVMVEFILD